MVKRIKNHFNGGEEASRECPNCCSKRIWKDGIRQAVNGTNQRFICRDCGHRFTESSVLSVNMGISSNRQVCASLIGAKNLAETKPQMNGLAGATACTADINEKILDYLWFLKKKGREELTIDHVGRRLRQLATKGLDLLNPEEIKEFLAKQDSWSNRTKANDVCVYDGFLKFFKISWEPPEYKADRGLPYVPTEEEIDQLISASGRKISVFLQLLKETGARYGEAARLKWTDIDLRRKQVTIGAEKHGNTRILPISERLIEMLGILPKTSEKVFPSTKSAISSNFYLQRRRIARKLGNPRLLKVGLHSFRHWKGTNARYNGLDVLDIQLLLGHRDVKSTMLYVHLEKQVYQRSDNENFHVRTARTIEEASRLIEAGFEFVHEYQGIMIYRKRK